ncbi:MAG: glycosyltransferase family 9 protein [Planctomycetota bacterium]
MQPPPLPDRILIVRLGAIGDVVNALTVAAALKDRDPAVRIGWLVHPLARPLVENNPVVDRVHVVPRQGLWKNLGPLRRELRAEGYGLTIDLQRMQKSAVLGRLAGAPRYLGYDRARCKEGAWVWYREHIATGPRREHMVLQYRRFGEYLGCDAPIRHSLPPDRPAERAWCEEWLAPWSGHAPTIVHIGASKPENRWNPERYAELVQGLLERDSGPVLLTGGPGDRADAAPAEAIARGNNRFRSLVGQTDLLQLLTLLRRARLYVSCDTGPMHMAAAVGCPVVALFGPADPCRTGPFGPGNVILRDPPAPATGPLPSASMESVSSSGTLEACLRMLNPS